MMNNHLSLTFNNLPFYLAWIWFLKNIESSALIFFNSESNFFNLQWEAIAIDSLQLQFQSFTTHAGDSQLTLSFIWCPVIIRQTQDKVGYFFLHRKPRIKSFVLITSSSLPLIRLMNFGGGQSSASQPQSSKVWCNIAFAGPPYD